MKLTNTMRDAFVRAAMNDVPTVDYSEQIRKEAVALTVAALPEKVRKAWADTEGNRYVNTICRDFGGVSVQVPGISEWSNATGRRTSSPAIPAEGQKKLHALIDKHRSQEEAQTQLRSKLHAVAYSRSTRKALADALPEFEKYLPADERQACRTLPVVANVVADFVKAGWPKGKKPAPSLP